MKNDWNTYIEREAEAERFERYQQAEARFGEQNISSDNRGLQSKIEEEAVMCGRCVDERALRGRVIPFVPFYDRDGITIYHADCRQVLPFLDHSDLLLTDPPYGIGADKQNAHSSIRDNPDWSHEEWDRIVPQYTIDGLLDAAESQIIWGGNYYRLPPAQCWLIWEKPEAGTGFSMADAELAWTNLKQSVRVKRCNRSDGGRVHPTQKPLSLMKWCLSLVGDATSVLDPFMGSGTTLVAAKLLGLRAVGIEISLEYCEAAVERLRQGVLGFDFEG